MGRGGGGSELLLVCRLFEVHVIRYGTVKKELCLNFKTVRFIPTLGWKLALQTSRGAEHRITCDVTVLVNSQNDYRKPLTTAWRGDIVKFIFEIWQLFLACCLFDFIAKDHQDEFQSILTIFWDCRDCGTRSNIAVSVKGLVMVKCVSDNKQWSI